MRVHDVNVVADLNEQNPNSSTPPPTQDPPAGTDYTMTGPDGTTEGLGEYINEEMDENMPRIISPEEVNGEVTQWWTGPWPRLHSKIDYMTEDGYRAKYHISNDLLGNVQVEEEMQLTTELADDPINDPGFSASIADVYFNTLVTLWSVEMVLIITDIFTVWACVAWEKNPSWWPLAAITGAAWTAAFSIYLGLMINEILSETDNPFVRFWAIALLGISMVFGWSMTDFLKDLGVYLIQKGIHSFIH